jgi:hypothetical protein
MGRQIFTEGVFYTLIKLLSFGKIEKELRELERVEKDPETISLTRQIKDATEKYEAGLRDFCEEFPDNPLCKPDRSNVK